MEELDDAGLFSMALFSIYALCSVNVAALQFVTAAPYGKHVRAGWGPSLPASLAWFLMESSTLWLTLLLYPCGLPSRRARRPLSLYLLHYVHRALVYPLRLHFSSSYKKAAGFPLLIALFGFAFNLLNAYLQSRSISHYADYTGCQAQAWLGAGAGTAVFFWGMVINSTSDSALVRLKAEGGGYKIPRGRWFELVSSPNYMGEMMEWLGWAVMARSPAALGFFLYTCSKPGAPSKGEFAVVSGQVRRCLSQIQEGICALHLLNSELHLVSSN